MDTSNKFMVMSGDAGPTIIKFALRLTTEEAINLAAWLAALTDHEQVAQLIQDILNM